ncbi:hypothetical protein Dimus_020129 [Dionaea muscipula]
MLTFQFQGLKAGCSGWDDGGLLPVLDAAENWVGAGCAAGLGSGRRWICVGSRWRSGGGSGSGKRQTGRLSGGGYTSLPAAVRIPGG